MKFIYDKNRYKLEQDKESGNICLTTKEGIFVVNFTDLYFLRQINDNEFITIDYYMRRYWFSHISYIDGKVETIYKTYYAINDRDNISYEDNVFILQNGEREVSHIYNCLTKKEFKASNFIATKSDVVDNNNTPYIIGWKNANKKSVEDRLYMLINSETLETTGFYSNLQEKFISIKVKDTYTQDNDFMNRFFKTVQEEVYPFLESYANSYEQETSKRLKRIKKVLIEKI